MNDSNKKIGPIRSWALAAGGMVGGGIYIALGVVIEAAGQWAWASFVIAGIAALITAYNYAQLSNHYGKSGGAFEFLEEMNRREFAGSLSWLLIIGYTLTISVYAYAFGHYVAYAFAGGEIMIRMLAIGVTIIMIGLNLLGAGKLTGVEVVIVSGNLLILLVMASFGIAEWNPAMLSENITTRPASHALVGAAAIFVSYEGFQLLAYEYEDLEKPKRFFVPVMVSASLFVIGVYVAVALGATMIAGAGQIVASREIALSKAAEIAIGTPGLIAMTIAAAFATSAAINSTLFSTAKLSARVAEDKELPKWFDHRNQNDIPDRAVIGIGLIAGLLAITGSLSSLVEAASMIFVVTFTVVNVIAARVLNKSQWLSWSGAIISTVIGVVLLFRLAEEQLIPLILLLLLLLVVIFVRPRILAKNDT